MRLAVAAIATCLPAERAHDSLLGTVVPGTYGHLYDPAGNHSRPPTVRRGATRMYSAPYRAPTAADEVRNSDLASQAVAAALAGFSDRGARIDTVYHTHCTLDQHLLDSACLRIEHDHAPGACHRMSVGQLGTAGVPTTLRLAAGVTRTLACVSASDKWLAPMVRRVPGVVIYGDASAACVVGAPASVAAPLALIEAIDTVCMPLAHSLWHAAPAVQLQFLADLAASAIEALLARHPDLARASLALAGDDYGAGFAAALQARCRLGGACLDGPHTGVHLSSAAPLFALARVIASAGKDSHQAIVWTASTAGHAAAMLVTVPAPPSPTPDHCHPGKGEAA